jgi:adenylosuccinate synthase
VARRGLRAIDLFDQEILEQKIRTNLEEKNFYLTNLLGAEPVEFQVVYDQYLEMAESLKPFIKNVSILVDQVIKENGKILFEGAQGTHLDIDHGTYPFVTSSNPVSGSVCAGVGVGPDKLHHILGIVKAYTTRVGSGPFPTELLDETGNYIQEKGAEFGATTGRRRRCGWLDLVMMKDSIRYNGLTSLSMTKLDVLTGLDTVKACVSYDIDGEKIDYIPASLKDLARCKPVYEEFPGWKEDISSARSIEDLPEQARNYLKRLEEIMEVPFSIISVGPMRDQTIEISNPF